MKSRIGIISGLLLVALVMFVPPAHAQTEGTPPPAGTPPPGGRLRWRAMRKEMLAACVDKAAGAPCSFSRRGQPVSGTCRPTRRGKLICRKPRKGGHGQGLHGPTGSEPPPLGNAPAQ